MSQTLTTFDAALKQHYTRDRVLFETYKDHKFLAMVPKKTNAGGRNIPVPIVYGNSQNRSAAFATAQAGTTYANVTDFVLTRKADYSVGFISGEVIEASKGDVNAFLDAMTVEVDSAIASIKESAAKALYGSGSGKLGVISSGSTVASTSITLATVEDVENFEVGMEIVAAAAETSGSLRDSGNSATITAIDRDAGTLTTDSNWSTQISALATGDYLFAKGDRNEKMTGLLGWIPTTAPGSTSFFGVDRTADVTRLGGVRYDGSSDAIDQALITGASRVARRGGKPDYAFVNFADYANLEIALGAAKRYENVETPYAEIGFRALVVSSPSGPIKVLPDLYCPKGYAFVLQMDTWKLYSVGDVPHILDHDGRTSLRQSSADGVEVRVGYYGQLGCRAPGWNGVVTLPAG